MNEIHKMENTVIIMRNGTKFVLPKSDAENLYSWVKNREKKNNS